MTIQELKNRINEDYTSIQRIMNLIDDYDHELELQKCKNCIYYQNKACERGLVFKVSMSDDYEVQVNLEDVDKDFGCDDFKQVVNNEHYQYSN